MPSENLPAAGTDLVRQQSRRRRLAKWDDYTEWVASKVIGFAGLSVGGLEMLDPAILPLQVAEPGWWFGIGSGLILGKRAVGLLKRVLIVLLEEQGG